jgi:hypothetical protein
MSGQVLFNGELPNEKTHHRDVAFVSQEDVHFRMLANSAICGAHAFLAMLTIKETFEFSMQCHVDKNATQESRQTRVTPLHYNLLLANIFSASIAPQTFGFKARREHFSGK